MRKEPTRSNSQGSSSTASTPSFSLMVMQRSLKESERRNSSSSHPNESLPSSSAKSCRTSSDPDHMTPRIGMLKFKDGRIFEGEHIGGHMIQGKMIYADGSVYHGGWLGDKRHGRGVCTFVDGAVYDGEFYQGNFHGHGKMTWNDGGWYVGQWCKGEIHGKGIEVRPNGSIRHDGVFNKGVPIRSPSPKLRKNLSTDSPEIFA